MRLRIYIAALISFALFSGTARAAPFGPAEEQAWAEAVAAWGGAVPTNCTSLTKEVVPPGAIDGSDGHAAGRATQPSFPGPCGIWIVEGLRPCELRGVMKHEYGHLLGYGHSADPLHPMSPSVGVVQCQAEAAAEERAEDRRDFRILRRSCRREADRRERRACWREVRRIRREASA